MNFILLNVLNSNLIKMHTYGGAYDSPLEIGKVGSYTLFRVRKSIKISAKTNDDAWHSYPHNISNVRDIWIDENMSRLMPETSATMLLKLNNALSTAYVTGTDLVIKQNVTSYGLTADLYILYTVL